MEEIVIDENPYELRDRFAKLVVGTIVGFIAKELTEKAYDVFIIARRNR